MNFPEKTHRSLEKLIKPLSDDLRLELLEVNCRPRNNNNLLEIVIDKEGGVTLSDCSDLSDKISELLNKEDIFSSAYLLEVSSPGIFRELKTERDFLRNINAKVKAVFKNKVKGRKRFTGDLKSFEDQNVTICDDAQELKVELENIKKIQLCPKL